MPTATGNALFLLFAVVLIGFAFYLYFRSRTTKQDESFEVLRVSTRNSLDTTAEVLEDVRSEGREAATRLTALTTEAKEHRNETSAEVEQLRARNEELDREVRELKQQFVLFKDGAQAGASSDDHEQRLAKVESSVDDMRAFHSVGEKVDQLERDRDSALSQFVGVGQLDDLKRQLADLTAGSNVDPRLKSLEGELKRLTDRAESQLSVLEDRIGGVEMWVGTVEARVGELADAAVPAEQVEAVASQVQRTDAQVGALGNRFAEVEQELQKRASQPEDDSRMRSVEERVSSIDDRVAEVVQQIEGSEHRFGGIETWVGAVESRVVEVAQSGAQASDMERLELQRLADLESAVDSARFEELEHRVMELASAPEDDSRLRSVEDRVSHVDERVAQVGRQVEGFEGRVGGIESWVGGVETKVGELEQSGVQASEIERLELQRLADLEGAVDKARFQELEHQVMDLASTPEDDSRMRSVEEQVSSVNERVTQFGQQVEGVEGRVGGIESWVGGVESKVGELEQSGVRASEIERLELQRLADLEGVVDKGRFQELEHQVLEMASRPEDHSRIQSVEEMVSFACDQVQEIESKLGDVENRCVGFEGRVDGVEAQLGEVAQGAAPASEIERLEVQRLFDLERGIDAARFEEVEQQVMELMTRPNDGVSGQALDYQISLVSDLVTQVDDRVTGVETEVEKLGSNRDDSERIERAEEAIRLLSMSCPNESRLERLERDEESREVISIVEDLAEFAEPASMDPMEADDLKRIHGIGKVLEGMLNDKGIHTFDQLGSLGVDDIEALSNDMKHFADRVGRDRWIEQARALAASKGA